MGRMAIQIVLGIIFSLRILNSLFVVVEIYLFWQTFAHHWMCSNMLTSVMLVILSVMGILLHN